MEIDETVIPKGDYCYTITGKPYTNPTKTCPYWEYRGEYEAYCHFLKEEDDILLWDQVKICGVNMREEDVLISTD
jgi:hypothetical protein